MEFAVRAIFQEKTQSLQDTKAQKEVESQKLKVKG